MILADTLVLFIINSFVQTIKNGVFNNSFLSLRWQGLKVHHIWWLDGPYFVFLIRKWANLIGLCLMDDGLLFLMTDLWPFIGTISSSMGIFYFIFMVDPSTLTIVLTQFIKNIKKDQNTHVILYVLVYRHKSVSINHFVIIEFYLEPNLNDTH